MKAITEIKALHREGQLEAAEKAYLKFLSENPKSSEAYDGLGVLYTQQANYPKAITALKKAIELDNTIPQYYLHLANTYKLQHLDKEAIAILEDLTQKHSDYAPGFNNLGTLYYNQNNLNQAIAYFKIAIEKVPDYVDALYNLSLAYRKNNDNKNVFATLTQLLNLAPTHLAGRFQLAKYFMQENKYSEAIANFKEILNYQANHFETYFNLANCYLNLHNFKEAKHFYLKALELNQEDAQTLFNLGVVTCSLGDTDKAIQYYQLAILANPSFFEAHNNLAILFQEKNQYEFALKHWEECRKIQPDNKSLNYKINAIKKHKTTLPPAEYISSLFDAYSDHYDEHLVSALDYNVPQLFLNILENEIPEFTKKKWNILDLGCGTGLASAPLKAFSKKITGVDISGKMLSEAKKKNIFDQMIEQNVLDFLQTTDENFNLVIAADVLVYFGDLALLLQLVQKHLESDGFFLFNTEINPNEEEDYRIKQSGRFEHSKKYLYKLATQNNFKVIYYQTEITRTQNNEPVFGHLLLLKRVN